MAGHRGSDQPVRRTRRVAGQRRGLGQSATPPAPSPPEAGTSAASETLTAPVSAPPRPAAPGPDKPGWRARLAGLRPRPAQTSADASWWDRVRQPGVIAVVLIGLIVVLGTLTGLYLQGYLHARAVANAREDAVQSAKVGMPRFASYDYKTFDADVRNAEKYLTPKYRKEYDDFQQKAVRTSVLKYKAAVKAEMEFVGVTSGGTDKVRLVAFLSQTTTNSKLSAPKLAHSRLHVDMRKVNGTWLIESVSSF